MQKVIKIKEDIYKNIYGRKSVPMITFKGIWLQDLGFIPNKKIIIEFENGKLTITPII